MGESQMLILHVSCLALQLLSFSQFFLAALEKEAGERRDRRGELERTGKRKELVSASL